MTTMVIQLHNIFNQISFQKHLCNRMIYSHTNFSNSNYSNIFFFHRKDRFKKNQIILLAHQNFPGTKLRTIYVSQILIETHFHLTSLFPCLTEFQLVNINPPFKDAHLQDLKTLFDSDF